jgi:tetratricopeptide (TPR) repeat protein
MIRLIGLSCSLVLLYAGAAQAQGSITVIGGGLAEVCSKAVRAGRFEQQVLDACSIALETEALRRRDRAATYNNRGIVYLRMMDLDEALSDFERAERLNPNIGELFVNRGAVLISQRKHAEALAQIDRGLTMGIEEPHKAYYNRAIAKEALDDMRGAYFDYKKAVELDPTWTLPQTQLARFTVTTR